MAKKKVYAVKRGLVTGLFYDWDACKEAVSGYPGAEYKGFTTEEEAKRYLGEFVETQEAPPAGKVVAYVDGSYEHSLRTYSFGCVFITPEGETIEFSGNGQNEESAALRNVAGEMLGAMFAVRWAIKKGYKEIELRYDYEGIEKWVAGVWKAKTELTKKYADYMQGRMEKISITFTKVDAHTGNFYNEEADRLAKEALVNANGIPEI